MKTSIPSTPQVLGSRTSARTVSFLYTLLTWNPGWRSSAQESLKHAYFRGPRGSAAAAEGVPTAAAAAAGRMEGSEVAGSALAVASKKHARWRLDIIDKKTTT